MEVTGAELGFGIELQVLHRERSAGKKEWEKVFQFGRRYRSSLRKKKRVAQTREEVAGTKGVGNLSTRHS